jgi:GntR family transcriptional repressor for pyruvate dehydrogenase complex
MTAERPLPHDADDDADEDDTADVLAPSEVSWPAERTIGPRGTLRATSELMTPLNIPAAYQHVVDRLRRLITLGEFLPGERLPSERALAEAFQVSRLTVREALRTLQGEGVVESRRGNAGGAVVLEQQLTLENRQLRLRALEQDMTQNHEFRLAVEPMAARLAAGRRTASDIAVLRQFDQDIRNSRSIGEFRQADSAFHLGIAAASGNQRLRQAVEDARSALFVALDAQDYELLRASSADGHDEIVDAIEARDQDAASTAMLHHLEDAWQEIMAVITG